MLAVLFLILLCRRRAGFPAGAPRVLAYHKIARFEFGGTWMTPARFRGQIAGLIDDGFRFIDEATYLDRLRGNPRPDKKEILLTFDDGYRDVLDAAPVLADLGVPALVFLVSDYVGRENRWELSLPGRRSRHLDWGEIEALASAGFFFGSHGRTHRDLTRLGPASLRDETAGSKRAIEDRLRRPVRTFSYPYGRVDERVQAATEEAGYEAAFTLYPRRGLLADRWLLRREGVWIVDTLGTIRAKLGGGLPAVLEDCKGRAINAVAVLTPLVKGDGRRNGRD